MNGRAVFDDRTVHDEEFRPGNDLFRVENDAVAWRLRAVGLMSSGMRSPDAEQAAAVFFAK